MWSVRFLVVFLIALATVTNASASSYDREIEAAAQPFSWRDLPIC